MKNTIQWMYDGHRAAMKQAVMQTSAVDQAGNLSCKYAASLYLLTGLKGAWQWLQLYVTQDGIDYKGMMHREWFCHEQWLIVELSESLFNDGNYIDRSLVDLISGMGSAMLELAMNGLVLRCGNPTLAMLEKGLSNTPTS